MLTKNWHVTKNIVAIVLMLIALAELFVVLQAFSKWLEVMIFPIDNWNDVLKKLPLMVTVKYHFGVFNGGILFIGAFWLLKDKPEGWLLSVFMAVFSLMQSVLTGVQMALKADTVVQSLYWFMALTLVVFASAGIVLLSKPFRHAYKPDRSAWLVSISSTVLLVLLRAIIML